LWALWHRQPRLWATPATQAPRGTATDRNYQVSWRSLSGWTRERFSSEPPCASGQPEPPNAKQRDELASFHRLPMLQDQARFQLSTQAIKTEIFDH
jgi:hypothetical protein